MNNLSHNTIHEATIASGQPGSLLVPSQPIGGSRSLLTQVQQVKAAGISAKPNVAQPTSPAGVSPNTQGIPANLAKVAIARASVGDQYHLTVSFHQNPGDPYYQSTKIYLKSGSNHPIAVGEGTTSPIKIAVSKTSTPTTVIVQATGNWGSVPIQNCPVKTVSLV